MQERYLNRAEAAAYLSGCGLRISRNTLQKMATLGPEYRRFGNRAVYTAAALDRWADAKLSAPRSSTAEATEAA